MLRVALCWPLQLHLWCAPGRYAFLQAGLSSGSYDAFMHGVGRHVGEGRSDRFMARTQAAVPEERLLHGITVSV